MHQRIRARSLERGPHPVAVADVDALELGFGTYVRGGVMSQTTIFSVSARRERKSTSREPM